MNSADQTKSLRRRIFSVLAVPTMFASMLAVAGAAVSTVAVSTAAAPAAGATTVSDSCGYTDNSHPPASLTTFNESTITRWAQVNGVGTAASISVFTNDESGALLGVNGAPALGGTTLTVAIAANSTNVTSLSVAPLKVAVASGDTIVVNGNQSLNLRASAAAAVGATSISVVAFNTNATTSYPTGTIVTDSAVSTEHLVNPSLGSVATDPAGRPQYPALFITDISGANSASRSGDWQQGGSASNLSGGVPFANDVFGSWATATEGEATLSGALVSGSVHTTLSVAALTTPIASGTKFTLASGGSSQSLQTSAAAATGATSISVQSFTANANYPSGSNITYNYVPVRPSAQNNWNLGAGSDTPTATGGFTNAGFKSEGYGNEIRWNVNALQSGGSSLSPGHTYRIQVMTHDGDQNQTGGDVGEYCTNITIPGPPVLTTSPSSSMPGTNTFHETIPVGGPADDNAFYTGSNGPVTGTDTFKLYFVPSTGTETPDPVTGVCSGALVFTDTESITAGKATSASYNTSTNTATGAPWGTYYWQSTYNPPSGGAYLTTLEPCGNETVTPELARLLLNPPSATNAVGTAHVFTAEVDTTTDGANWTPLSGQTVTFSKVSDTSGSANFVGGVDTCVTGATAAGRCTVTLNDANPGTVTVNAAVPAFTDLSTWAALPALTTGVGSQNSANAVKTYEAARIALSPPTATNVVGTAHTFTATVSTTTDGTTWSPVSGVAVTFSKAGDTSQGMAATLSTPNPCTTDVNGQCSVNVNDANPGTVTVHAASMFTLSGVGGTFSVSTGTAGNDPDSTKVFEQARILLNPPLAINDLNSPHVFTAEVDVTTDGTNWTAQSGVPVTFTKVSDTSGTATLSTPNPCTTNNNGQCTISLNDANPGTIVLNAATMFTLSGVGGTFNEQTSGNAQNSSNATKIYIGTQLSVTDVIKGLPAGATGNVTYTSYGSLADCQAGANPTDRTPTNHSISGGVVPSSTTVLVGPPGITAIWFTGTYSGNEGTFTTACHESATAS